MDGRLSLADRLPRSETAMVSLARRLAMVFAKLTFRMGTHPSDGSRIGEDLGAVELCYEINEIFSVDSCYLDFGCRLHGEIRKKAPLLEGGL